MIKNAHKVGAVFYILWGTIHIIGGFAIMSENSVSAQLAMQVSALQPEAFQNLSNPGLHSVLSYHGFNILWFGIFAVVIAVLCNWKNSKTGYWLNLLVISAVELGLITFLLIPGYMKISDGSIGLVLFVLAIVFSTIGQKRLNIQ